MTDGLRVSVLDTVPLAPGGDTASAVAATAEVAQAAEAAGYHRVWVAEHHASASSACAQPVVLIGLLAERTHRIRVGSGGVMLPNHSTLEVAEQFALLAACHGDRIDLGLGRAAAADPLTLQALGRRAGAEQDEAFLSDVTELTGFLTGQWPAEHPYRAIPTAPAAVPVPIHLLGASVTSATLAGRAGLAYVFGRNLAPRVTAAATRAYRQAWEAAGHPGEPRLIVSFGAICADSQQAADAAALSAGLARLRGAEARQAGRQVSVDELLDPACDEREKTQVLQGYATSGFLIGDSDRVAAGMRALAASTGASELMLVSAESFAADRIRTLSAVMAGMAADPARLTLAS